MAYAAVTSLLETLEQFMQLDPCPIHPKRRNEMKSLFNKVDFLQAFLEESGKECNNHEDMIYLEKCIRDVSYRTEDIFEELIFDYSVDSGSKKLNFRVKCWTRELLLYKKIQSIAVVITKLYDKAHAIKVLKVEDDFPLSQETKDELKIDRS